MDPSNSSVLYASSYQRRRSGCCFNGGGPGSGIWKTEDGGKSWTKLQGNGLPKGTYGRIALDVSRSNPNVVYAQIEAGETGTTGATGGSRLHGGDAAGRSRGDRRSRRTWWPRRRGRSRGGSARGRGRRRSRRIRLVQQRRTAARRARGRGRPGRNSRRSMRTRAACSARRIAGGRGRS